MQFTLSIVLVIKQPTVNLIQYLDNFSDNYVNRLLEITKSINHIMKFENVLLIQATSKNLKQRIAQCSVRAFSQQGWHISDRSRCATHAIKSLRWSVQ